MKGVNTADTISDLTEYLYQALSDKKYALSILFILICRRRLTLLITNFCCVSLKVMVFGALVWNILEVT